MSTPTPSSPNENSHQPRQYNIPAEHELRFEIPSDSTPDITLTLEHGSAEIFGIELALSRPYTLPPGLNAAVFTWHGATLSLVAPTSVMAYTATDTPMPSYISAHYILQSRREMAKVAGIPGPRCVVVGPRDCGKSALVAILASYCVKANGAVTLVDMDPSGCGAGGVVPGAVGLSLVKRLDFESGGLVHGKVVSMMVGHVSPRHNRTVSEKVFGTMGTVLDKFMARKEIDPYTGCIADTSGDVDGTDGTASVIAVTRSLSADVVFVLGAERLYASISKEFEQSTTETVLLAKSGGVVSRDDATRMAMRSRRIKDYFYGVDNRLSPFSTVVDFAEVTVLKVGGMMAIVPDSVLPIGAASTLDPLKPLKITMLADTLHKILGVSQAVVEEDVMTAPVYGFVHVVKVDHDRNTMTILAPSPGKIPSNFLLAGDTKWIE